jgi:hypothetical protein
MSKFRLSDLGNTFKESITAIHPNISRIHWDMMEYNLKEDTITGDLTIDILNVDEEVDFNKLKAILELYDLDVAINEVNTCQYVSEGALNITQYIFNTQILLDDFPAVALSNYIKDAEETLSYEWNK